MKIKRFEVDGLLNRSQTLSADLDDDLVIFTGKNGAGKTSLLKLLWGIVSGNILIALDEVPFQRARVVTSEYDCTVHRVSKRTCKVEFRSGGESQFFEDVLDSDGDVFENAEDLAKPLLVGNGSSVFVPTFRRIEGGFTISSSRLTSTSSRVNRARGDLEESLVTLSRALTQDSHAFVAAISTGDINNLLLRKLADLSEEANALQTRTSQEIIQRIKGLRHKGDDAEKLESATAVLEEVRIGVEQMELDRLKLMSPMDEVKSLVERLFENAGIRFGARMTFGDAANAVSSDQLSAGEKQMLSFVCYNAFYKDAIFFIDEPELSLHADWQRQLFSILQRQQSTNQFIIATHSPFIYGKYPDKEVELAPGKGGAI